MAQQLRSGYTTGTHATAIFLASLEEFFNGTLFERLCVVLPQEKEATIEVQREALYCFSTIKGDNDDMDVTKGCTIRFTLSKYPPQNLKEQTPSLITINKTKVFLYAGDGVGVVTKKGLKITPPHPAINPTPLLMMQENARKIVANAEVTLYGVFSVVNGQNIAKETANAKVGVVGGISILGTRGIVKPVSASAYIDSIEAEIAVSVAESQEEIVFTLGNSAYDYAKEHYNETCIIEIGNFVYDALERLQKHSVKRVVFITSVAKMCKVAQGFKNTHNRFGSIDFDEVKRWLYELDCDLGEEEFVTLKGVLAELNSEEKEKFIALLSKKALLQLQSWSMELQLDTKSTEVITLPSGIKREIKRNCSTMYLQKDTR